VEKGVENRVQVVSARPPPIRGPEPQKYSKEQLIETRYSPHEIRGAADPRQDQIPERPHTKPDKWNSILLE